MKVKTLISRILFFVTFFSLGMSLVIPVFTRKEKFFLQDNIKKFESQFGAIKIVGKEGKEIGFIRGTTDTSEQPKKGN